MRGRTLGASINLFLQLKVSDAKNYKTDSIDLRFFEIQCPYHCYDAQVKFCEKIIANLVAHMTQFIVWQKDQYSSKYGSPKFVDLLIDLVLKVSLHIT